MLKAAIPMANKRSVKISLYSNYMLPLILDSQTCTRWINEMPKQIGLDSNTELGTRTFFCQVLKKEKLKSWSLPYTSTIFGTSLGAAPWCKAKNVGIKSQDIPPSHMCPCHTLSSPCPVACQPHPSLSARVQHCPVQNGRAWQDRSGWDL